MDYKNVDIILSPKQQGQYDLEIRSESFGDAFQRLEIDSKEITRTINRLNDRQTDRDFMIRTGTWIYERLFTNDIQKIFHRSQGESIADPNKGLCVRMDVRAPELNSLPWELMYSSMDRTFLATQIKSPVLRYLSVPVERRDLAAEFPLRVLVVIPLGHDPNYRVDVKAECAAIQTAVGDFDQQVHFDYLHERCPDQKVTYYNIREALAESVYHGLHFVGHGTFSNENGYLVLDGEDGDELVADQLFAALFANEPSMRFVFLNACKGATSSNTQPLTGVAAQIVLRGVPAVIAMQFSVYDDAAIGFARAFYHSLFRSREPGRVDVAMARGRQVLEAEFGDQRELAAPVMFTHTAKGVLFQPERQHLLADLHPDARDTLQAAAEETSSVTEQARFKDRIRTAKLTIGLATGITAIAFLGSYMQLLDLFALDTRAEFLVMAIGNDFQDHEVSDDLRIVTIDGATDVSIRRQRLQTVLEKIDRHADPKLFLLAIGYSSQRGEFKYDPESGARLAASIDHLETDVLVGTHQMLQNNTLGSPEILRQAVAGIGHGCTESKLDLVRGLSIAYRMDGRTIPSLALMGYAVFHDGVVTDDFVPTVAFPNRVSKSFEIAKVRPSNYSKDCAMAEQVDSKSIRFLRRTPQHLMDEVTTHASSLDTVLQTDPSYFENRIVVVGLLQEGQKLEDLFGRRDVVVWQADALNNLLLDVVIKPTSRSAQFFVMLMLALATVSLRLKVRLSPEAGLVVLFLGSMLIVLVTLIGYVRFGVLANPTYYLATFWLAWWATGRYGKSWLT